jgi:cation:H+ antiporter
VFIQYLDVTEADIPTTTLDPKPLLVQWGLLLGGIALIIIGIEGLVFAAVGLGNAFGTPSFLWGLTVVAAATSLPDTLISVAAARIDEPAVSLGNVLGSNIFDLLVALPAGIILAGSTSVSFTDAVPMMAFLIVATIALFTFARTNMEISNAEATGMLVMYAAFVGWLLLESVGLVSIL